MKLREWMTLPKLENEDDFSVKLKVGDKFLYGTRMIDQLETKQKGQEVCFYQVLKISGKNVEYTPRFDHLEEEI